MSGVRGPRAADLPARTVRRCMAGIAVAISSMLAVPVAASTRADAAPRFDADAGTRAAGNAVLVRAAFDAWSSGTGSVFDLLHGDVVWTVAGTSPVSGTYASRRDFLDHAVQPITARLATPIVPELRHLVAQDDAVVAVFDGVATARDGTVYRNSYAWHMVLEEGRVVRVIAFLDTWTLQALMEP